MMAGTYGPHPLSSQLQVKLPTKLAKALHMKPGDEFYWRHSDDDPDVLLFIPSEVLERRYTHGEQVEKASRERAEQLPTPTNTPAEGSGLQG